MKLALLALLCIASASSGDRLAEFEICKSECIQNGCPPLALHLKLLLWTCESECDYQCQQSLTTTHVETGSRIHQFHGKWPFVRMWGIQEPASVFFSVLNFLAAYFGLKRVQRCHAADEKESMRIYYILFACCSINAWVWSTVFHIRDFLITERLDYFGAVGSIVYGFFLALVRIFRLDKKERSGWRIGCATALLGFFICHCSYLSFVKFDYAYNMAAGVIIGVSHNIMWCAWSISEYKRTSRLHSLGPTAIVVAVMMGMSFELIDFAPLMQVFDAHSLWHASTALPCYFWYIWMEGDLDKGDLDKGELDKGKQKGKLKGA